MITNVIIGITVVVSVLALRNNYLFQRCLFNPYVIDKNREWHRFFTHAVVHADYMHLFFNMFVLWSFGKIVEQYYFPQLFPGFKSMLYFSLLYIGGVVLSSYPSFEKHKEHSFYNSVGASGAVSAVVFSGILINPMQGIYFFFVPFEIPGFIFAFAYLGYSWYMSKRGNDNIGHDAHFWGAIFGIVFTGLLKPKLFVLFLEQLKSFF